MTASSDETTDLADVKALGSGLAKVARNLHEVRYSPSRPAAEAD